VNALRGHSNIQGVTDLNAYAEVFSGYLSAPTDNDDSYEKYLKRCTPKPCGPTSSTTGELPAFFVSLMKSYYGKAATPENNWATTGCPSWSGFDVLHLFELMHQGKMNGFCRRASTRWPRCPTRTSCRRRCPS
jgi:formate dehydrogenase major subunit